MRFVGFIGPSYQLNSVDVDCQRCIGLYPELNELGTGKEREVAALVPTPGLGLLATIGEGPIRGTWRARNGRCFAVSKNKLYEVHSDWTSTELGTLQSSSGQVGMADNSIHLVVVDGPRGYSFEFATNTLAEIVSDGFYGATHVVYLDGYLIFNRPGTQWFYWTNRYSIQFDGFEAEADGAPDNLVGIAVSNRDLWLIGEETTEVFYNTGDSNEQFLRIQGAFLERGSVAPHSIAAGNDAVFWIGRDKDGVGTVYMARGFQPQRISTHAIEQAFAKYGDLSDAVAYTYQENGHYFYILNFTSANTTWCYDMSTGLWHERVYLNQGQFERHRANSHTLMFGKHVVGDYENGNLYELSSSIYSDNGAPIVRERVAPHISEGLSRLFFDSFQLDVEAGVGLDGTGQGTDPQIMLQFSNDGAHTWSSERWKSLGRIGQKKRRAIWDRLGSARDRVYRVRVTDPVKTVFIGAEMRVRKGAN